MRPFRIGAMVTLLVTGCAHSPAPAPSASPSTPAHSTGIDPANIKRVARELPPGYEVTSGVPSAASPRVVWGLDWDATTKPPQCATLGDPGNGRDQSAQGLSGSGEGGIVDAIVVSLPTPADLDNNVVAACGQWTATAEHTTARVRLTDPPHIDGAATLGMIVDTKTTVESGTEIDSRAYTFTAYLGNYYAFTTLTIDPGSGLPDLPPQFAADLLVKTVSTLRS
jgi:hypothetical protein